MSHKHDYQMESVKAVIVRYEPRWWGRPLLWLSQWLSDVAYIGAERIEEEIEGVSPPPLAFYTTEHSPPPVMQR